MTLLYTFMCKLSNGRKVKKMKKSTGIIRRVDELGRIVIPIELREKFRIKEKDSIEIFVDGQSIILKKYETKICHNCGQRIDEEDKFCKHCGKEV